MFGLVPYKSQKPKKQVRALDPFGFFDEDFFAPMMNDEFFARMQPAMNSFKVDVKDEGDKYEITAEFPGVKKENIKLDYRDNYLTIAANEDIRNDQKDENGNYIHRERRTSSVSRSFYIDDIDESKISAELKDGVLKIELPKLDRSAKKSSSIEIK